MQRLHHLDVLRGVAMLGILPVNIAFFALPSEEAFHPGGTGRVVGEADLLAANLVTAFATQKFITLFSLLFGVGMMLMRQRSERRGDPYAPVMLRRLGALWVLGILHATLLWYGDVVSIYAPLGLVLCWAGSWRPQTLLWTGVGLICAPVLCCGGFGALASLGDLDPTEPQRVFDATAPWWDFVRDCFAAAFGSDHAAFETAVFRDGSFARITVLRTAFWLVGMLLEVGLYYGWRLAGLFLVGMAFMKQGWFGDPAGRRDAFRRLFWWGFALGAPLQAAALCFPVTPTSGLDEMAVSEILQYTGSLGLAAAYAAVVCVLAGRHGVDGLLAPFAAVGRTAFSNYVGQSVICGLLFYSYGFAQFGRFGIAALMGFTAGIWLVQLTLSTLWTRRFAYGPLEWAWRCATYATKLPLRREETA